jgi:hypothetical protein
MTEIKGVGELCKDYYSQFIGKVIKRTSYTSDGQQENKPYIRYFLLEDIKYHKAYNNWCFYIRWWGDYRSQFCRLERYRIRDKNGITPINIVGKEKFSTDNHKVTWEDMTFDEFKTEIMLNKLEGGE